MRETKLKPISVDFIDKMGDDKRVANVARVSFAKWDDTPVDEKDKGLLAYLATGLPSSERDNWEAMAKAHTHFSPFCHVFLSVRVQAPFFLARQLVKHQIGLSWNEESRRYIKSDVALWLPDVVHKAPAHAKQGASDEVHSACLDTETSYGLAKNVMDNASTHAVSSYYDLLDSGVAPEEARIVLPLNAMTTWIWSGSLLAFNRVYQLRKDAHAQGAAQEFAHKLGEILYEHFPESMRALNYGE